MCFPNEMRWKNDLPAKYSTKQHMRLSLRSSIDDLDGRMLPYGFST